MIHHTIHIEDSNNRLGYEINNIFYKNNILIELLQVLHKNFATDYGKQVYFQVKTFVECRGTQVWGLD